MKLVYFLSILALSTLVLSNNLKLEKNDNCGEIELKLKGLTSSEKIIEYLCLVESYVEYYIKLENELVDEKSNSLYIKTYGFDKKVNALINYNLIELDSLTENKEEVTEIIKNSVQYLKDIFEEFNSFKIDHNLFLDYKGPYFSTELKEPELPKNILNTTEEEESSFNPKPFTPERPFTPEEPFKPFTPEEPFKPFNPKPFTPEEPFKPFVPKPFKPFTPEPFKPFVPEEPFKPFNPKPFNPRPLTPSQNHDISYYFPDLEIDLDNIGYMAIKNIEFKYQKLRANLRNKIMYEIFNINLCDERKIKYIDDFEMFKYYVDEIKKSEAMLKKLVIEADELIKKEGIEAVDSIYQRD